MPTSTKAATLYLGQCPFRAYTLTVVAESEAAAWKALTAEYAKAIAPRNTGGDDDYPTNAREHFEYVGAYVSPMTAGKVEWL